MGTARQKNKRSRKSTSKIKPRPSSKRPETSQPKVMDNSKSARAEELDRLLLSSLKYWEVERDLIEERLAARGR
jgi:hypothetical protein